jgi:hypothetical protein
MKQLFEDYAREVKVKAEYLAQEAEIRAYADHLQAFNFGRSVERITGAHLNIWLRLGWLLIGTLIGVLATVYVQSSGARLIWPYLK